MLFQIGILLTGTDLGICHFNCFVKEDTFLSPEKTATKIPCYTNMIEQWPDAKEDMALESSKSIFHPLQCYITFNVNHNKDRV